VKVLNPKNRCCVVAGTITQLLTVQLNGSPTSWLEMWLGEIQTTDTPLNYLCFELKEKQQCYIPQGWGCWTVAKQILLMLDPTAPKSNRTHYVYNHRIKWEITDRWPGETVPTGRKP